eukprot:UN04134
MPTQVEAKPNPQPKYPTNFQPSGSPPHAPSIQTVPRIPKNININTIDKTTMCLSDITMLLNRFVVRIYKGKSIKVCEVCVE